MTFYFTFQVCRYFSKCMLRKNKITMFLHIGPILTQSILNINLVRRRINLRLFFERYQNINLDLLKYGLGTCGVSHSRLF